MKSQLRTIIRHLMLQEIKELGIRFVPPATNEEYERIFGEKPKQLSDTSEPKLIGDPLTDVDLNQMENESGSDEDAATAVAVKAGAPKAENDLTKGQRKTNFLSKTEAPSKLPGARS
jgi:hypothetical protein